MNEHKLYRINVRAFLFVNDLGEEIDLPYSDELDKAVLLINGLCAKKVSSIKKTLKEEFLIGRYQKLIKAQKIEDYKNRNAEILQILEDISNYDKI